VPKVIVWSFATVYACVADVTVSEALNTHRPPSREVTTVVAPVPCWTLLPTEHTLGVVDVMVTVSPLFVVIAVTL
jgi:hypothetical protein